MEAYNVNAFVPEEFEPLLRMHSDVIDSFTWLPYVGDQIPPISMTTINDMSFTNEF